MQMTFHYIIKINTVRYSVQLNLLNLFRLKKANIGYEHMFEEVPISIKNSHLMNVLMWDLEDKSTLADKHELLSLSSRSALTMKLTFMKMR